MSAKIIAWTFLIGSTIISLAIVMAVAGFSWGTSFIEMTGHVIVK